jgi:hypothetical protein
MEKRTVSLAEQLLESIPKSEVADLITLLEYYNRFAEADRAKAVRLGSETPKDANLEREVERLRFMKAASQNSYITSGSSVCKCCGK